MPPECIGEVAVQCPLEHSLSRDPMHCSPEYPLTPRIPQVVIEFFSSYVPRLQPRVVVSRRQSFTCPYIEGRAPPFPLPAPDRRLPPVFDRHERTRRRIGALQAARDRGPLRFCNHAP